MDRTFDIDELLAHSGWLRALAARLVADPGAADDLVQDTWIAALRRPPRAGAAPRPWLARVARNLARNARRDGRTRGEHEARGGDERRPPTPEAIAIEVEAQRLLAEAVGALAEPGRTIVVLRYFRGLDSADIGRGLDIPPGTVRWRLKQALDGLRAALDRRAGGREAWAGILVRLLAATPAPPAVALGSLGVPWVVASVAASLCLIALFAWRAAGFGDPRTPPAPRVAARPVPAVARAPLVAPAAAVPAAETGRVAAAGAPSPRSDDASITGRVRVDGELPPRPLRVEFRAHADGEPPRFAPTAADGSFALDGFAPGWEGTARVAGYAFEDDGDVSLTAPQSGVELHVRGGPALTGRFLLPDGAAPIPLPDGRFARNMECRLAFQQGSTIARTVFACTDDEGLFGIGLAPDTEDGEDELDPDERMTAALLAEVPGVARVVVESPEFVRAEGFDLGDVVLRPAASVRFRVLDPTGAPVAGAVARHADWPSTVETDADGYGTLSCVALEGETIRFAAARFREQVLVVRPGDEPVVVLEPTTALAIRVVRSDGTPLPELRIHVTERERLFRTAGDMLPSWIGGRGHSGSGYAGAAGESYLFVRFAAGSSGELLLRDLEPDVPFSVEVHARDGRVLAVRGCVLGAGEWQDLVVPLAD
jgi:RNA polymerase sigma-70 factor (ECF subfamily)